MLKIKIITKVQGQAYEDDEVDIETPLLTSPYIPKKITLFKLKKNKDLDELEFYFNNMNERESTNPNSFSFYVEEVVHFHIHLLFFFIGL